VVAAHVKGKSPTPRGGLVLDENAYLDIEERPIAPGFGPPLGCFCCILQAAKHVTYGFLTQLLYKDTHTHTHTILPLFTPSAITPVSHTEDLHVTEDASASCFEALKCVPQHDGRRVNQDKQVELG